VEEYISAAPKEVLGKLEEVREAIMEVAPEARESIGYGIPYYYYKGQLAWFGPFKEHIALLIRPPVLYEHRKELEGYAMTKSSLHLPLNTKVPVTLVKKLVKFGIKKNEERASSAQTLPH
jgi:uncharacterized protein YdhG (YjbR/CyaY superfamily)